ncbi:hypothetical protein E2C01_062909 [Portunus trituberculatus]|uniref:Uncharacterized protein n=1 Tax=Portunus trituberculatus TaxID=210409 RepID=A0A5B7HGQ9_PORTR|nr:hypothetical protein [Portunus trituberculatus]
MRAAGPGGAGPALPARGSNKTQTDLMAAWGAWRHVCRRACCMITTPIQRPSREISAGPCDSSSPRRG